MEQVEEMKRTGDGYVASKDSSARDTKSQNKDFKKQKYFDGAYQVNRREVKNLYKKLK